MSINDVTLKNNKFTSIRLKLREAIDNHMMNHMMRLYTNGGVRLFSHVEIETINRCNGKCSFCPVNVNEEQRPYAEMSDTLFKKIIDELGEIKYENNLALFSNNEPFLDKKIIYRMKYAREVCKNASIFVYTNGSVLNMELFLNAMNYLDYMVIDVYSKNNSLKKNLREIYEYSKKHNWLGNKVKFGFGVSEDSKRTSRGGSAPNRKDEVIDVPSIKCNLMFEQLIIRPDGKVSLCCNDALGAYTLGDINSNSILEIWYGDLYKAVREKMINEGRIALRNCRTCDTVNMTHCDWHFRHWF